MRAEDQYHVGIVVDDLESARADLTELFGYEWCEPLSVPSSVVLSTGETVVPLTFTYSMTTPRLELIRSVPGTPWTPAEGSGIHHIGYWSDDVAADSARLRDLGYLPEATGVNPEGAPIWAYNLGPTGPRIELVSRSIQPFMEKYWAREGPGRTR